MTVLELLEEMTDIMDTASAVPLTGKVMVDKDEVLDLIQEIQESLPEDVKQAKWVREEKGRILDEAKQEYKKLVAEAKKEADRLVETNDITLRAKKRADEINQSADEYAKEVKMRMYDYLDKLLYDMQGRMQQVNEQYLGDMFSNLQRTFDGIDGVLNNNREELRVLARRTKDGEDWMYDQNQGEEDGGDQQ